MAALTITCNEKPAAATIRDRLDFVYSTTRTPLGKELRNGFIHSPVFPFKTH